VADRQKTHREGESERDRERRDRGRNKKLTERRSETEMLIERENV